MGVDYRAVNGYIYISVDPVTDPAKIGGTRSTSRSGRATLADWDESTPVAGPHRGADGGDRRARVPTFPSTARRGRLRGQDSSFLDVIANYSRALRLAEQMWQDHFEFLLLGYGAYLTFSDYCRARLPTSPSSTSRR